MTLNGVSILRAALRNRVADERAFAAFVREADRPDAEQLAAALEAEALAYLVHGTQRLDAIEAALAAEQGVAA